MTNATTRLPRRQALMAGLGALALTASRTNRAGARTLLARGMIGGGLAQFDSMADLHFANFALFASAMQMPEGTTLYLGQLQWIEAGGRLRFESSEITQCVPLPDRTDGAQVRGWLAVNGEGDYPFLAHVFDAGGPGSGLDRIVLQVNTVAAQEGIDGEPSDTEFSYEIAATLIAGDLQWIMSDIQLDV